MTTDTFRHEDQFAHLDSLSDWKLEISKQDIRGRPLVTPTNVKIGMIDDLLVEKGAERVSAIKLEDDRICAVERLEIEADRVIYHPKGAGVAAGTVAGHHGDARHKEKRIPVVEEKVAIGKRMVDGGAIRVTSNVVSEKVAKDLNLRDETVKVERREVNRAVTPGQADAMMEDGTVEMREHDEEAVVQKQAFVTDEVVVSKDAEIRKEHVEETARRTDIDVEKDRERNKRR
ncbi:YsnF/AvaK domain-containing protein [Novosphingopyxis iocasae]|uniref:YsnF/AvaK domain-containing protein n=1 Tax=Novosphingopyxis iocasae TaxID=2762729 RepID=UPI0016512D10|nr:YsnF/AvaK domain-containing protein [Novosphingopyxis iocasae]